MHGILPVHVGKEKFKTLLKDGECFMLVTPPCTGWSSGKGF